MADYAKMYRILFNAQTQVIEILQKTQLETEEIYISDYGPDLQILDSSQRKDKKDG